MLNEQDVTAGSALFCSFQDSLAPPEYRKWRRVHGLQLPLHPLQLAGWLALLVFGTATFLVLVPALGRSLQQPILGVLTGLFLIHVASHLAALLTDPADPALLKIKSTRSVPEFDRSKHAHVIENGRCHLCNIKTLDSRTKHCSVCNKCVSRFDHHCKWLNHCIGARNYVPFLMCVVSAVTTALVVLAVALAELVLYHVDPTWLMPWDRISATITGSNDTISNDTNSTASNQPIQGQMHDTVFLLVVAALGLLAAITAGLLLHLCFFHVYISFLGLTTYEYIRNYRQNMMATTSPESTTRQESPRDSKLIPAEVFFCSTIGGKSSAETGLRHRPSTLHCCDTSRERHTQKAYHFCSVLEETRLSPDRFEARTFHCCSEFRPSDSNGDIEVQAESVIRMSEQCTFCTFRVKKPTKIDSNSTVDKKCCLKTINKHHRWRRKWNCCSSIPDSPDSPGDPLGTVTNGNGHQLGSPYPDPSLRKNSLTSPITRERTVRQWPLVRLRYLFRMISQLRRPRNRASSNPSVRQNQVLPLVEATAASPVHTVLPTSIIRSEMQLPVLPPPPRRRLRSVGDLQDLADTLAHIQQPRVQNNFRRHRRKNILQGRSPTLSPIHESGLSNPASPQPCRHATCASTPLSVRGACTPALHGDNEL